MKEIDREFLNPLPDPHLHQNWISVPVGHASPLHRISWNLFCSFPVDYRENTETNTESITSLADVKKLQQISRVFLEADLRKIVSGDIKHVEDSGSIFKLCVVHVQSINASDLLPASNTHDVFTLFSSAVWPLRWVICDRRGKRQKPYPVLCLHSSTKCHYIPVCYITLPSVPLPDMWTVRLCRRATRPARDEKPQLVEQLLIQKIDTSLSSCVRSYFLLCWDQPIPKA